MTTQSGKATVTHEDILIPIASDGDCAGIPVQEPTVEAALKSFEWNKAYLGFKFAEAVKATVTLDNGQEDTVEEERASETTYLFATKVINLDEFATGAEYKDPVSDQFRKISGGALKDRANVLFSSERGLNFLEPHEQNNTVLVNKQGQQLFPKSGVQK